MNQPIDLLAHVDEAHAAVLGLLPEGLIDLTDISAARARLDEMMSAMPAPELPASVQIGETTVPGFDGDPDVRVKTYRPADLAAGAPAMLWIHGGGMVLLDADNNDPYCAQVAAEHDIFVASVDYRLAPETPAPGLVHDCYAALTWLAGNADELGVDAGNIMIGGASAGGGLAAGTALFARDNGGPALVAQLLVYPMIDHTNTTPSSHAIHDSRVWNRAANIEAWRHYLGGGEPTIYSSPSTATDLSGLPAAYINVGTLDMFLDEDVAYAQALNRAGVPCELHVYPGAFHGSTAFVADHPLSIRWEADQSAFVGRSLRGD